MSKFNSSKINSSKINSSEIKSGKFRYQKVSAVLLICLMLVTFNGGTVAYAGPTAGEVQSELDDVEQQQKDTSKKLSQVESDIKNLSAKVNGLTAAIRQANNDIENTENNIAKKEKEMATRQDNLNSRLRVMYKNGSVGFVDVLLGSNSIQEFISNVEMIQKIYKNDIDVMETLQKEYNALEKLKKSLNTKKKNLSAQKEDLKVEKTALDEKKKVLEEQEDELEAQAKALEKTLLSMIDTGSEYVGGVFTWPCPSSQLITSQFGYRMHPVLHVWKYHSGIDIGAGGGQPIVAAGPGRVIMAQWYGGYGNCVMIDHGGGVVSLYGHASVLNVSQGQNVTKGQTIAKVGTTGISTGNHLHFEVRKNGAVVDPISYLKG